MDEERKKMFEERKKKHQLEVLERHVERFRSHLNVSYEEILTAIDSVAKKRKESKDVNKAAKLTKEVKDDA